MKTKGIFISYDVLTNEDITSSTKIFYGIVMSGVENPVEVAIKECGFSKANVKNSIAVLSSLGLIESKDFEDLSINKNYSEVNEVIKVFYDGGNKQVSFTHASNRKATEKLLKAFGLDKTKNLVKKAIEIQSIPYAPIITSPSELWNKMAKLEIFLNNHKAEKKVVKLNNDINK